MLLHLLTLFVSVLRTVDVLRRKLKSLFEISIILVHCTGINPRICLNATHSNTTLADYSMVSIRIVKVMLSVGEVCIAIIRSSTVLFQKLQI